VIPAFDAEDYVLEAIDDALAQEHPHVEVIVVDDGSTDRTPALLASRPQVRVIRQPNRGPAAARNAALAVARGEFVATLDADDCWPPDRLTRQVEHLRENPAVGIVFGLMEAFSVPPRALPPPYDQPHRGTLGAALIRAEIFELVGPFDEARRFGEDLDWLLRATDAGVRSGTVEQIVHRYRLHAGNMSRAASDRRAGAFSAIRAATTRRRSKP
jgi:glycosyltransferase involved in cell wall biosynthesis